MQPSLFGDADELPPHCRSSVSKPAELARATDPATSHRAAAGVQASLGGCKAQFVAALQRLGSPSTAHEIALEAELEAPSAMRETYRKRAGELVRAGLIEVAGERPCKITGKSATIYRLSP